MQFLIKKICFLLKCHYLLFIQIIKASSGTVVTRHPKVVFWKIIFPANSAVPPGTVWEIFLFTKFAQI